MASSVPLRSQNQTQDHTWLLKQHGPNKVYKHLRTHTTQPHNRGTENQDPNQPANSAKGVSKLKGVSRLPVLAKSLQPVPTDTSQTPGYNIWEEKPLVGKAQKRKSCTKAVPFSLSQSRVRSQNCTESSESASRFGRPSAPRLTPGKTLGIPQQKTKTGAISASAESHAKLLNNMVTKTLQPALKRLPSTQRKPQSTDSASKAGSNPPNHGIGSIVQNDLSSQLNGITLTMSQVTKDPSYSFKSGVVEDKADAQPETLTSGTCISATGECGNLQTEGLSSTPRPSTCPSGPGSSVYLPQRVSVKKKTCGADGLSGVGVKFSPDPSALRSILLNEGVNAFGSAVASPRESTCPSRRGTSIYSAQRVPIQKPPRQTAAQAALHSIPLNEEVKVGGPAGTTPRVSVCPSGRRTSIYSAQRVPVKKSQTGTATDGSGATGGAVSFSPDPSALRSILLNEGVKVLGATPRVSVCPSGRATSTYSAQRVPVRKRTTDATAIEATQNGISRTPATKHTPLRVPYTHSQSMRRQISIQRTPIFRDSSVFGSTRHEEDVVQRLFQEEPEPESSEKIEENGDQATSSQAQEHQQTVEPQLKHEEETDKVQEEETDRFAELQCDAQSTTQSRSAQTTESQCVHSSDMDKQMLPSMLYKAKSAGPGLSLAACALRRRLPALEEMLLDDECATYTSTQQLWPMPLRCSNPVASTLLFQDSICFKPINFTSSDLSPGLCFS